MSHSPTRSLLLFSPPRQASLIITHLHSHNPSILSSLLLLHSATPSTTTNRIHQQHIIHDGLCPPPRHRSPSRPPHHAPPRPRHPLLTQRRPQSSPTTRRAGRRRAPRHQVPRCAAPQNRRRRRHQTSQVTMCVFLAVLRLQPPPPFPLSLPLTADTHNSRQVVPFWFPPGRSIPQERHPRK